MEWHANFKMQFQQQILHADWTFAILKNKLKFITVFNFLLELSSWISFTFRYLEKVEKKMKLAEKINLTIFF